VREAVRAGALSSAHDIADGGLAVALAECCLAGGLGARVELDAQAAASATAALFGEAAGGFLVSAAADALAQLGRSTPLRPLGSVGGDSLSIVLAESSFDVSLDELARAHASLADLFG
jgi:phosphoribosylformylglycinamidine synthase subunit PurL